MPLGLTVSGRRVLDAGASTGGFTDVLLRNDAAQVVAVDVGYGQLAWRLRQDPRVVVHDRTNIRDLSLETIGAPVDLVVGDLSFISLELVLDALLGVMAPDRSEENTSELQSLMRISSAVSCLKKKNQR